MCIFLSDILNFSKKIIAVALIVLCLNFLCWSLPARAVNSINPDLEQKVLQILREHPEVIVNTLQAYQQKQLQQLKQAQQSFLYEIRTNPKAVIANSPTTGASESKMLLVEFSDFQCPYCAKAEETIAQFLAAHPDDVTLVYKHFPLISIHPEAMPAAKAAWAAGQQNKFWEYHDALFSQQDKLGDSLYLEIAQNLNLDMEKFENDRAVADRAISQDIQLAQTLGIAGTPFFVMNGQAFSGAVQLSDLENIFAKVR